MPPTGTLVGADADDLERAAAELRAAATQLDGEAGALTAVLSAVDWIGGVATWFAGEWNGTHRTQIDAAARDLRDAASRLDQNAVEQRVTSRARGAAPAVSGRQPGGGAAGSWVPDSDDDVAGRLDEALGWLGLARTELAMIAEFAANVDDDLFSGRLIDLLGNPRFRAALKQFDQVLDVGAFVVDLVTDVAEHPDLSFDERLVHGLTDAATRFGISEGVEKGAALLASALTTTLLPIVGVALAPVASMAASAIAEMLVSRGVEALDDTIDFVDTSADGAVEIYRDVKAVFGFVLDGVDAVVDVVGDTVDLVGTAGDWAIDRAGDLVGGLVDGTTGVFRAGWLGLGR